MLKKFFRDSETLFWARLQMLVGFLTTAAATMDWNPLISLVSGGGFNRAQLIGLAVTLLVQGALTEWLRRHRAEDL